MVAKVYLLFLAAGPIMAVSGGRPVLPQSPILVTRPADGGYMEDGIPTVSIDEVCSRTLDRPRYCDDNNPRLPIDEKCDNIVRAGYIPKGCDGAYMAPQDRDDYCDAINRAGEASPYFCFDGERVRRRGDGGDGRRGGRGGNRGRSVG